MSADNLKEFLEKMIKAENSIVESVSKSLGSIDNLAVKSALKGVSYDSMKHAEIYRSAISLLDEYRPIINEKQFNEQDNLISKHIVMEENIIKNLEFMMSTIENDKILFLLKAVLSDEKRHHKMLMRLREHLIQSETITEEDWWDAIWRDVPGLWT